MDYGCHMGGHWYITYLGTVGLRRTNWDYPWGGDAVPCRGQLVPLRELLRGVLGKVRAERGGMRGDRAQVSEVGNSQISALMLQGDKMGLWAGIQSNIGIEEYVCGSERLQRECRVTYLGFLVVT